MDSIQERASQIILEQLGIDAKDLTPDATLVDDLGCDSLDTVELVMAFEEEFGIEIPDESAMKVECVRDIYDYLNTHAKV